MRVASMPSSRKLFCDTLVAFTEIDAIRLDVWTTPGANSVRRVKSRPFSGSSLTRRVSIVLLISGVTALTVGIGGATSMTTATLPTSILTLRATACPTSTLTDPRVTFANPLSSTVMSYSAGFKFSTRYSPSPLRHDRPDETSRRLSDGDGAPGSAPPVASVIRPSMSPYVVWVDAVPQSPQSRSKGAAPTIDTLRRRITPECPMVPVTGRAGSDRDMARVRSQATGKGRVTPPANAVTRKLPIRSLDRTRRYCDGLRA